jgi:hypothetical protein
MAIGLHHDMAKYLKRWLLVKSNQAKVREEHILNKVVFKSSESSLKSFSRLCRKGFSCAADAQKLCRNRQILKSL